MKHTNFRQSIAIFAGVALLLFSVHFSSAGDWPGWRGPTGLGYTEEKDLPLTWDAKTGKNILWKVSWNGGRKYPQMSSPGWSCPIVWRDRVFLTTAVWPSGVSGEEYKKIIPDHHVLCHRASDGKQLWDTVILPGKCVVDNHYHGYAISTPVTDGEHVFALFGSGAIAALDFDGKIVWREELPHRRDIDSGTCSSLVLYGDSVILPGIANPVLRALDKKSGKLLWEQKGREQNRMATPAILRIGGRPQLIHMAGGVQGIDPDTGELLWSCRRPVRSVLAGGRRRLGVRRCGPRRQGGRRGRSQGRGRCQQDERQMEGQGHSPGGQFGHRGRPELVPGLRSRHAPLLGDGQRRTDL